MLPTASGSSGLQETTLDEPVMDTLKREFRMIANKMYKVRTDNAVSMCTFVLIELFLKMSEHSAHANELMNRRGRLSSQDPTPNLSSETVRFLLAVQHLRLCGLQS
jgi:hypothetical protein